MVARLLVLFGASALLSVTVWILVPAPNALILPLGVAAPELSPVLLAASIVLAVVAGLHARTHGSSRLALIFTLVSAAISSWPLLQAPSTLRRFNETITSMLGTTEHAPEIDLAAVFRPPPAPEAHMIRGVEFAAPAGAPLKLDIYKPSASGPFPILVQVYGGAWQRGAPADNEWFARYFASRGYVVIAVDYRHAPEWKWPAQLDDVRAALQWTVANAARFDGDPGRIALIGRSAGAQLAMTAAFRDASPSIRAVVSYYGPVDLVEGWRHPPRPDPLNTREILETFLGGTPDEVPDRYRQASPITYVARTVPPTLLIYGARDHVVEARFGEQLDRAMKKAGATSVLLEIPWSEHAFDYFPTGLGGQLALFYTERFLAWAIANPPPRAH